MNAYRSIDSHWDHSDVIFLDEGKDTVPIRLENNKHNYVIHISEKIIENKMVFASLKPLGFKGKIKLQIPDQKEIYYGWFENNSLHREDGPAFVKIASENSSEVLAVQWLLNGSFNENINENLIGLDRLGNSLKFFYRIGSEKFQLIRSERASSTMEDATEGLKEVVNKHFAIDFNVWDNLLNSYNPEL